MPKRIVFYCLCLALLTCLIIASCGLTQEEKDRICREAQQEAEEYLPKLDSVASTIPAFACCERYRINKLGIKLPADSKCNYGLKKVSCGSAHYTLWAEAKGINNCTFRINKQGIVVKD